MAIETGGGAYGGAARGFQEGVGLFENIQNAASERQARQQQLGMEQQRLGIEQRGSQRADQQQALQLHQAAITAYGQEIDVLRRRAAAAEDAEASAIKNQIDSMDQERQNHLHAILAPQVLAGVQQTMADQRALTSGTPPDQIGGDRLYKVSALINPQPISLVNDYNHPPGVVPAQQHLDAIDQGMQTGDHGAVRDAAGHLLSHTASPYGPDHDNHTPGLSISPQNTTSPDDHLQAIGDGVGRVAAVHAALNSDHPDAKAVSQLIVQGYEGGAQQQVDTARLVLHKAGGLKGLQQQVDTPDQTEQAYMQHRDAAMASGATPAQAHQQAVQKTVDQSVSGQMDHMRLWYLQSGLPIPEDLKQPEQERARDALIASGVPKDQATLTAYAPSVVAEQMRSKTEYGVESLRAASAEKVAGIRLQGMAGRGLQGTIGEIDQQVAEGTLDPEIGAQMKRDALQSAAHRYDKPKPGDKSAVTDIELHREAAKQAEDVYKSAIAANPDAKVDIGQITQKLYSDAKAARDQPPAAAAATPSAAQPPVLPPAAAATLKENQVTTFKNGQKWTMQGGKPVQVQ